MLGIQSPFPQKNGQSRPHSISIIHNASAFGVIDLSETFIRKKRYMASFGSRAHSRVSYGDISKPPYSSSENGRRYYPHITSGSKPPPGKDNGRTSKLQARWEEMNRREKMDRELNTVTARTDHQKKDLNDKKSKEEHRRVQWDQNQKSQRTVTTAAHCSTVEVKTSKEPTAANSKSKRGLAKVQGFVTKPWTKAPEARVGEHKEGRRGE